MIIQVSETEYGCDQCFESWPANEGTPRHKSTCPEAQREGTGCPDCGHKLHIGHVCLVPHCYPCGVVRPVDHPAAAVSPARGQEPTPEQMRAGTCPLTTDTLEALRGTTDQRQLGFIFFCHRQSIIDALSNVLAPASPPAEHLEPPTPWRVDDGEDYCRVLDAKGNVVLPNDITSRALYRRIVEAVSGEANLKCELETAWRDNAYLGDQRAAITTENQRLKNESESRMNMARLLATQAGTLATRLKDAMDHLRKVLEIHMSDLSTASCSAEKGRQYKQCENCIALACAEDFLAASAPEGT